MRLSLNAWEMGQAWHLKGQGAILQKRKALMYDLLTWRKKKNRLKVFSKGSLLDQLFTALKDTE